MGQEIYLEVGKIGNFESLILHQKVREKFRLLRKDIGQFSNEESEVCVRVQSF